MRRKSPALERALMCCCAYMSKAAWMANSHAILALVIVECTRL